jgi:hypothetical protein
VTEVWTDEQIEELDAVCATVDAVNIVASVLYNGGNVEEYKELFPPDMIGESPFENEAWEILKALCKADFLKKVSETTLVDSD